MSPDNLWEDEFYNLWVLLSRTRDAILRVRDKELAPLHINASKSRVLFIIQVIGDKATPAEIARQLLRKSHSISDVLSKMEKEGLVRKVKDLDRKNLVRVSITEKGMQVYQQSLKKESLHRIISSLSDEQIRQLDSSLRILWDRAVIELGSGKEVSLPPRRE